MRPTISEFSYGYTVTDELIHWHGFPLTAAPVFPSLFAEGQSGGGWDLRLDAPGVPLFLQFKLSNLMVRNTAMEAKAGAINAPFYRMHLRSRRRSQQHQLLLDLEQHGHHVFYVAPLFSTPDELNDAYLRRKVKQRSVWVAPSWIGPLADDDEHWISFKVPDSIYVCSEPKLLDMPATADAFGKYMFSAVSQQPANLSVEYLTGLCDALSSILRRSGELFEPPSQAESANGIDDPNSRNGTSPADSESEQAALIGRAAYIAKAFYDCETLIVRRRD